MFSKAFGLICLLGALVFRVKFDSSTAGGLALMILKSLIIHEEKAREITTVKEVCICGPNSYKIR